MQIVLGLLVVTFSSCSDDNTDDVNSADNTITNDGAFVTTWNNTRRITIPVNPSFEYNYDVDWDNDGVFDELGVTGSASKFYITNGPHTIRIRGQFPAIQFGILEGNAVFPFDDWLVDKIVAVEQWGTIAWASMAGAFATCSNLEFPAQDTPDLSGVTSMASMFRGAFNANPDVGQWKVSSLTDMSFMFSAAQSATPDVSDWDVANVTNMMGMFDLTIGAAPDVSNWDVSNVTNMAFMFLEAVSANPDVSDWKVANVNDMANMFFSSGLTAENYTAALLNFAGQPTQNNVSLGSTAFFYRNQGAEEAKQTLGKRGWNISDAGPTDCNGQ